MRSMRSQDLLGNSGVNMPTCNMSRENKELQSRGANEGSFLIDFCLLLAALTASSD